MLAYTTRGDGDRVVLFVHGVLSTGRSLAPLARRFVGRFPDTRVILPDLPGHGASPAANTEPTIDAVADRLVELLAHVAPGPVDVVGHSMGGRIAANTARRAPQLVRTVALLDAPIGPLDHRPSPLEPTIDALLAAPDSAPNEDAMRAALARLEPARVQWLLGLLVAADDRVAWSVDRAYIAALRQSVMHANLYDATKATPVFVLRGLASPFVTDEDADASRSRGVEVAGIEDAGHDLHVAAARAVLEHLAAWLDRGHR